MIVRPPNELEAWSRAGTEDDAVWGADDDMDAIRTGIVTLIAGAHAQQGQPGFSQQGRPPDPRQAGLERG